MDTKIKELYDFMVKKKVLKLKTSEVELEIDPSALVPEVDNEAVQEFEKELDKLDKEIDLKFWSV